MAILAHKEQALFRAVVFRGMPTHRTRLTGKVGINLDGHTSMHKGFIGKHTLQFCKCPRTLSGIRFALLGTCASALLTSGTLSNACQMFQANERMRISLYNLLTHSMIDVLPQPSLSPTNRSQSASSRTSAFLLKTLSHPCVMIGLWNNLLARIKSTLSFGVTRYCKVAYPDIHTYNGRMHLRCRVGCLDFKGHN